jgi:DegV family protein with EDD domain
LQLPVRAGEETEVVMKWMIVADSSSDMACMKESLNGEVGFTTVALRIDVGDKEFVDDENLDVDGMIKYLLEYKGKSGSAAPGPGEWKEAFEKADNVIAITITGSLSGSYRSACAAKDMVMEEYPDKNILVIDSLSTGPEMVLLVNKAMELASAGLEFDQVCMEMQAYSRNTHLLFVIEAMDNLVKNGRVHKLEGGVAAILGIKVMGMASEEGTLTLLKKSRGKLKVYDKLIEEMLDNGYSGGKVVINHCNNIERAEYIKTTLLEKFPQASITIMKTRGLCSFYAENMGVLVGYEKII